MRQVLFRIPIRIFDWLPAWLPDSLPIYGFAVMLIVAFIICTWITGRRAEKEGIAKQHIQDLAIWVFVAGIVGARITFMIQYGVHFTQFFKIWQGGLVFYGSFLGGLAGYLLAYHFVLRKHGISNWKMVDICAPAVALGLCFGRIGCLLNGCCYGHVACCAECPAVSFPLSSPSRFDLVSKGYQTAAGFTIETHDKKVHVGAVDPDSPAFSRGLRSGDEIVKIRDFSKKDDDRDIHSYADLAKYLDGWEWPRGKTDLALTVRRQGEEKDLPPFTPWTLGLHPTQIYESISMALLFFLLSAYYPLRRRDGEVLVLFMICYPVHRFLNEMLRDDTPKVWDTGMTLSQNGSIIFFLAALLVGWWLWRKPVQYRAALART